MVATSESDEQSDRIAYRFSNICHLNKRQSELDFVDILVDTDLKVYLDPYALSVQDDEWSIESNNLVVGFFQHLIDVMREGRTAKAHDLLNNLHEPDETRLGESRGDPHGRGLGHKQALKVHEAFANSKAVETGVLADLSDCELFIDGISFDKVSDITTNIIRQKLVEFTQQQCEKHNIRMEYKEAGPHWDQSQKKWINSYEFLPVYRGQPLLLVPKRAVRRRMIVNDEDYYNHHVIEFIREEFLKQECVNSNRALTLVLQGGLRVTKQDMKDDHPKTKEMLRKFTEEHPEILINYKKEARKHESDEKYKLSDAQLFEKIKATAHDRFLILVEEFHMQIGDNKSNTVNGPVYGAIGEGNSVTIRDISVYKSAVDASTSISPETQDLLKRAIDIIEAADAPIEDKDDAKENLAKMTKELMGDRKPGLVARYLKRIADVVKPAATILMGGKEIAEVIGENLPF